MNMIPKTIHYCWFGGAPLPDEYKNYIESWKKHCPGYEIKRWDESNFDFSSCAYAREAYKAKKWAFVSDYARFKIIHDNGGVYFDTDVELIKPIDGIAEKGAFMGIEIMKMRRGLKDDTHIDVNAGLGIGAPKEHPVYREILDGYENRHFVKPDGTYDQTTVVKYVTDVLRKYGFESKDEIQSVAGITVYPSDWFDPIDCATGAVNITDNTVSVHHYAASWADGVFKFKTRLKRMLPSRVTGLIISIKRLFRSREE